MFPVYYGFSTGTTALVFLTFFPSLIISLAVWCVYFHHCHEQKMKTGNLGPPEERLVLGLYASLLLPIGLFLFGEFARRVNALGMHRTDRDTTAWTSSPSVR